MLVYVKKFKFYNLGIVLLLILQNLLLLCSTFATMLSARLMMEGNLKKLMSYLLIIILLYVILNFIFWIYDIMVAKTVALMNQEVRKDLNRKLMSRSSEQFMQSDIGEYLSWYTNDVKETENQGFMNLYEVIDYTIKLVLGTIVLFLIKIELLICTLAVTGTVFFVSRHFEKGVEETSNKVSKAMERFTSIVKEQVSGFRVLKYFGHTQKFTDDIDNAAEKLEAQRFTYAVEKEKAGLKLKMLNTVGSFINNLVLFGMCALRIIPAEIFFGGGESDKPGKKFSDRIVTEQDAFGRCKTVF